jgi:uncharacterized membrane protein
MKINNNLFKGDESGAAKGMMLGAATGGVIGAAAGGTIGLYVAKNNAIEKIANEMGILVVDAHVPDVINDKEILEKGGIWYKKDNLILKVGDHPYGLPCDTKTLDNCYVYIFTPEEFLGNNYKDFIRNYSIKGMVVGALTGTFIGSLVGAAIGVLLGSDEDKGKKG